MVHPPLKPPPPSQPPPPLPGDVINDPERDFAHNCSINFTWQVGNKYETMSEKLLFRVIGTFSIPECAQNLAVNSRILPKTSSSQFLRIRIIQKFLLR